MVCGSLILIFLGNKMEECIVVGQDSGGKGVAVLFKNNFVYKVNSVVKNDEGQYSLIDIEMLNKCMTVANIYICTK